jgi:hypothetical protein
VSHGRTQIDGVSEHGLRKILGLNEEEKRQRGVHKLHSLPDIIRAMISRSMRWTSKVACIGHEKCTQNFNSKNLMRSLERTRRK